MNPSRWERLQEIFHRVLEAAPEERPALIEAACAGDAALRREVETLLRDADAADRRLGRAVEAAAADLAVARGAELIGALLGPYRVLERLGEGGMGEVFLAEQAEPVRRRVAIKIIKLGMDTREVVARFEAERQALALMGHPSIARVFDAGATSDGRPYFVMERVTGPPIRELLRPQRASASRDRLGALARGGRRRCSTRTSRASSTATSSPRTCWSQRQDGNAGAQDHRLRHRQGHRRRRPGRRARRDAAWPDHRNPDYMSPEQAAGAARRSTRAPTSTRSGSLLYELLTGALPLDGRRRPAARLRRDAPAHRSASVGAARYARLAPELHRVSRRTRSTRPEALLRQLRGDLDWIALKALEKERARRYTTPSEMAADIRRYFGNEAVQAGPPTVRYRAGKFVRRHRTGVVAASIVVVALVAGVVGTTIGMLRASRAERAARRAAATANATAGFLEGLFKESYPGRARGRSPSAREILDRGATRIESELQDQPLVRARLSGIIGDVYRDIGEYDDAGRFLHESVAILEAARPVDSLSLAAAYNRLGIFQRVTGRLDSARTIYELALGIRERALGPADLDVAASLNNLATVYALEDDFDRSIPLIRRALAIRERALDPNDPLLGATYNNLGTMLSESGDRESARPYYEKNLRIQEAQPGPETPGLAAAVYNLAGLEFDLDRYDVARPLYERALALLVRVYSPNHVEVSSALLNLGKVATRQGDYARAESTLASAAAIRTKVFGAGSSMEGKVDRARGDLWRREGRLAEARLALTRAVRSFEHGARAESLEIATTLLDYARCLRDMSDRRGERVALTRALAIREALLPAGDEGIEEVKERLAGRSR